MAPAKVRVALSLLKEMGLVRELRGARFVRRVVRELPDLAALTAQYEECDRGDRERLERMVAYAQSARCRWKILLEYFAEPVEWDRCEGCDSCRKSAAAVAPLAATADRCRSRRTTGQARKGRRPTPAGRGWASAPRRHCRRGIWCGCRCTARGRSAPSEGEPVVLEFASGAFRAFVLEGAVAHRRRAAKAGARQRRPGR